MNSFMHTSLCVSANTSFRFLEVGFLAQRKEIFFRLLIHMAALFPSSIVPLYTPATCPTSSHIHTPTWFYHSFKSLLENLTLSP